MKGCSWAPPTGAEHVGCAAGMSFELHHVSLDLVLREARGQTSWSASVALRKGEGGGGGGVGQWENGIQRRQSRPFLVLLQTDHWMGNSPSPNGG